MLTGPGPLLLTAKWAATAGGLAALSHPALQVESAAGRATARPLLFPPSRGGTTVPSRGRVAVRKPAPRVPAPRSGLPGRPATLSGLRAHSAFSFAAITCSQNLVMAAHFRSLPSMPRIIRGCPGSDPRGTGKGAATRWAPQTVGAQDVAAHPRPCLRWRPALKLRPEARLRNGFNRRPLGYPNNPVAAEPRPRNTFKRLR